MCVTVQGLHMIALLYFSTLISRVLQCIKTPSKMYRCRWPDWTLTCQPYFSRLRLLTFSADDPVTSYRQISDVMSCHPGRLRKVIYASGVCTTDGVWRPMRALFYIKHPQCWWLIAVASTRSHCHGIEPKVYRPSHSSDRSVGVLRWLLSCSSSIRLSSDSVSLVACQYCCSYSRTYTDRHTTFRKIKEYAFCYDLCKFKELYQSDSSKIQRC